MNAPSQLHCRSPPELPQDAQPSRPRTCLTLPLNARRPNLPAPAGCAPEPPPCLLQRPFLAKTPSTLAGTHVLSALPHCLLRSLRSGSPKTPSSPSLMHPRAWPPCTCFCALAFTCAGSSCTSSPLQPPALPPLLAAPCARRAALRPCAPVQLQLAAQPALLLCSMSCPSV